MCDECTKAREGHNLYSLGCIYCGARLIQAIRALKNVSANNRSSRATAVLTDWVKWGHDEQRLRQLVATNQLLEPKRR